MWQNHHSCGQGIRFQFHNLILFVIRGIANFVLSEAESKGASDISPEPHILTPPRSLILFSSTLNLPTHIDQYNQILRYGTR